jgi:RHS repeat-associated protein
MTRTLWSGADEIGEYDTSGTLIRRFIPDGTGAPDARLATLKPDGTIYWHHTDHQGSVFATSNSAGNPLSIVNYSPNGEPGTDVNGNPHTGPPLGSPFGYTGRQYDPGTGLYYYRARYYHPALGQFLSTDPIGSKDDPNLYLYVANDPVNGTDPSGNATVSVYYRDKTFGGHTYYHTYIVVTGNDSRGNSVTAVYRAGPDPQHSGDATSGAASQGSGSPPLGSNQGYGFGNVTAVGGTSTGPNSAIAIESASSDDGRARFGGTGSATPRSQDIISNDLPTDGYTAGMGQYVNEVNGSNTAYFPQVKDSNSFTAGAVERLTGRPLVPPPDIKLDDIAGARNRF